MRTWRESLCALMVCGCVPSPGAPSTPGASDVDCGCGPSPATLSTPGASDEERFAVSGVAVELDGAPVVDLFVTVSTEFCIPDRTDAEGAFSILEVDPGAKRLITYGETAAEGLYASVVFAFEADEALTLRDPVLAPALHEVWPLMELGEEQQIVTQDGLDLTVPADALTLAPFAPEELQVARVPLDRAPPFVPEGVELVDLFVLHPIRSTFNPPAPVSFPGDTGLVPGSPVTFHALDYELGLLVPVAEGFVDADGRPTTAEGQGLTELTWVGVSLE